MEWGCGTANAGTLGGLVNFLCVFTLLVRVCTFGALVHVWCTTESLLCEGTLDVLVHS